MSAELLRQKELESLHQRQQQQQRLLGSDHLGALPPGLPPDHPALRSLHDIPEGHPLREELARRSMLVLRHGAATPLLNLNHQQQQPGAPSTPKDTQAQSSTAGPDAESRKAPRRGPQTQLRVGDHTGGRGDRGREVEREMQDEEMKDSDSETEMGEERQDSVSAKSSSKPRDRERDGGKETGSKGVCDGAKETGESSGRLSAPCSSAGTESPSRHLFTPGLGKADVKYHLPPGFMPPLPALHAQSLPFGFPYANPYFHTGETQPHTATHSHTHTNTHKAEVRHVKPISVTLCVCVSPVWRALPVRGPASDPSVTLMHTTSITATWADRREEGVICSHICNLTAAVRPHIIHYTLYPIIIQIPKFC